MNSTPNVLLACLLLFLAQFNPLAAQWDHVYSDITVEGSSRQMDVIQTSDSGLVVASGNGSAFGNSSGFLMKYDRDGNELWYKEYDGYGSFYSVLETSDGGLLAGGTADIYPGYSTLVKLDANGGLQWANRFINPLPDKTVALLEAPGGYVCSMRQIRKVTLNGSNTIWSRYIFNTNGNGTNYDVQHTAGGYIACGFGFIGLPGNSLNSAVSKLDYNGGVVWNTCLGEYETDAAHACAASADGGALVTGWTRSFSAGYISGFLCKLDSAGNQVWTKNYGAPGLTVFTYDIYVAPNGDLFLTGSYNKDILLVKADSIGNVLWSKTYSQGYGYSLTPTFDGGFVIAASQFDYGLTVFKVDSMGNGPCQQNISLPDSNALFQTSSLSSSGGLGGNSGVSDVLTEIPGNPNSLSCNSPVGMAGSEGRPAVSFTASPNPVRGNGRLHVDISMAQSQVVDLALVDLSGRVLLEERRLLPSGESRRTLPVPGLAPGIYLLRMQADGLQCSRKIVVLD